jgi:hypothetical protein
VSYSGKFVYSLKRDFVIKLNAFYPSSTAAAPRRGTSLGRAGFSYVKPPPVGHAVNAATRRRFVMSDRERDPKAGTKPKTQRQPVVGEDVPDESKERHTEIAVEVGHQDEGKKGEKSR